MSTRTIRIQVTSGAVPTWFANQTPKTWKQFGDGLASGGPNTDITGQPTYGRFGTDRPVGLFAYSGGVADQSADSLLLWGGGHAAGIDNGVYEFSLIDAASLAGTPRWKTLVTRGDPVMPAAYPWASFTAERYNTAYRWDVHIDGSPVADHSSNGRGMQVWEPLTGSAWSTERAGVGKPANATWNAPNLKTWCRADRATGTWKLDYDHLRDRVLNAETSASGAAFYNPVQQHIYKRRIGGTGSYSVNPVTGVRTTQANICGSYDASYEVITAAPELTCAEAPNGLWLMTDHNSRAYIGSLSSYATWKNITAQVTPGTWPPEVTGIAGELGRRGQVWHAASNSFLLWHHTTERDKLWRFAPVDPANPWSGAWAWTRVAADASNTVIPSLPNFDGSGYTATYGRFNLIQDVAGSGYDALVLINDVTGPTYVYKLPQGSL